MGLMKNQKRQLMDGYLAEMRKANCLDGDFYRKEAGQLTKLSNGGYFVVEKSRIETDFCFGYHTDYTGHERSDAEKERHEFLESSNAFKSENLAGLDGIISALKDKSGEKYIVLKQVQYYRQKEPLNVYKVDIMDAWELMKQYGKGVRLSREEVAEICISDADRAIVLAAYEAERESLNKRLDTYLKKYGTKHLRTWTYWLDE